MMYFECPNVTKSVLYPKYYTCDVFDFFNVFQIFYCHQCMILVDMSDVIVDKIVDRRPVDNSPSGNQYHLRLEIFFIIV